MNAEILAPVGSWECLIAAVRCGADAVYMGGGNFNARRNAENFTAGDLDRAIAYAHSHGVRVYYTLNTLVSDKELPQVKEDLKRVCTAGADALILQDLGIIALVKECCPDMPLHASTQMSIHTPQGAKEAEKIGFKRVVLSREMSAREIKQVRNETELEIEYFVHGALCMCVSGQCYMSAFFGSRSGNRGLCAQPCRLPFKAPGGTGHDLSLKDNCLLKHINVLTQCGVNSFKIEGRMKRPEYVAAAVTAYKKALNGNYSSEDEKTLKNIFSRSGFTDGYFTDKRGRHMFGFREKENVLSAEHSILKNQALLYDKETPLLPFCAQITVKAGEKPVLKVSCLNKTVTVYSETIPQIAKTTALTSEYLRRLVAKSGSTQFYLDKFECTLDPNLSIPAKDINALRREALESLNKELSRGHDVQFTENDINLTGHTMACKPKLYLRVPDISLLNDELIESADKIIIPLETEESQLKQLLLKSHDIIAEIPRCTFANENKIKNLLSCAKAIGIKEVSAGNLAGIRLAKDFNFKIFGGLGLNLYNSLSLKFAQSLGISTALMSIECSATQVNNIVSPIPIGTVVYGHIPLMITRNCPLKNGKSCKQCDKHGFITDRKGEKLPVRCHFGCSEVFNPYPIYMCDKKDDLQSDFYLMYFTIENEQEITAAVSAYHRAAPANNTPFTRGLYKKGVK